MSQIVYRSPQNVRSVAVLGTGSVGASWAALFLAQGIQVVAYDPAENAEGRAQRFVTNAWPALRTLLVTPEGEPPLSNMTFVGSAEEAAQSADVIQENLPEDSELKAATLTAVDAVSEPSTIILSSTGGIPPSQLQAACLHPERLVVLHPFNPAHLMPLVEIVGGKKTATDVVEWAMEFARRLGKQPIKLNTEANGHMTNRLQFALVREAVACLVEGIASASDIEKAVLHGLAPRWVLMGSLLTLHLAGGPGGMKGILDHAGAAIEEWWTPSATPHLTPTVKTRLAEAAAEIADGASPEQWALWRDSHLVEIIRLQTACSADPVQGRG